MVESDTEIQEKNNEILLRAIGRVVLRKRTELKKGINKFSFEYDIGNGLLSRLEHGTTDTKITTLWKLANAFDIKFSELASLIEQELPEDFNFYD